MMNNNSIYNLKFEILLTNKEDVIRLQNLINKSCSLNVGESKFIKSEIDEIRNINLK